MKMAARAALRMALPVLTSLLVTSAIWYGGRTRAAGAADTIESIPTVPLAVLAHRAISHDPAVARPAILALRSQGSAGLGALFAKYRPEIDRHVLATATGTALPNDPQWSQITKALDDVSQQKDSYASHLFWYTDLSRAERASRATGRPILSLRLLGNLNDELSCANSRFFRTVLYPNVAVSMYLQSHYILHWQSERPVPTFTLDFGDGRKIVRTLTGNSIHYVLDSKGRVIDALPGLYGPQAFLRHLTEDESFAKQCSLQPDQASWQRTVRDWHQARFEALEASWQADGKQAFGNRAPALATLIADVGKPRATTDAAPSAVMASRLALSKSIVEVPVVTALSPGASWAVGQAPFDGGWDAIGQLHSADAALDANSTALMRSKHPDLSRVNDLPTVGGFPGFVTVSQPSPTAASTGSPMEKLVANFERAIAQDSVRNEYVYHAKLHQWFAGGEVDGDMAVLNRRVYSDLFLTPGSDRWLGLAPSGVYTALPNDGLIDSAPTTSAPGAIVSR